MERVVIERHCDIAATDLSGSPRQTGTRQRLPGPRWSMHPPSSPPPPPVRVGGLATRHPRKYSLPARRHAYVLVAQCATACCTSAEPAEWGGAQQHVWARGQMAAAADAAVGANPKPRPFPMHTCDQVNPPACGYVLQLTQGPRAQFFCVRLFVLLLLRQLFRVLF